MLVPSSVSLWNHLPEGEQFSLQASLQVAKMTVLPERVATKWTRSTPLMGTEIDSLEKDRRGQYQIA